MSSQKGKILAICVSNRRGMQKAAVRQAELIADHGIAGDAHAGPGHRQVSLLSVSSVEKIKERGVDTFHGIFAENLVVEGIELTALPVGTLLGIGDARLCVTQIGKNCHNRCAIYDQAGDCVMPREGIFASVTGGGMIEQGDGIDVLQSEKVVTSEPNQS